MHQMANGGRMQDGYDLTSINKGVILGITILVGKSPSASLNGTINLTIDKEKVVILIS